MPEKFARPRGRPKKNTEQNQGNKKGTSRKDNYRTKYTEEKFERAMAAICAGLSIRGAAKRYGVPYTTLNDRYSKRRGEQLGRSTELSREEEEYLVERIILLANWGFPLSKKDLTLIIKNYLDRQGRRTRNNVTKLNKIMQR